MNIIDLDGKNMNETQFYMLSTGCWFIYKGGLHLVSDQAQRVAMCIESRNLKTLTDTAIVQPVDVKTISFTRKSDN